MKLSPKQNGAIKAIWRHGTYQTFEFEDRRGCEIKDKNLCLHLARIIHCFVSTGFEDRKLKLDLKKLMSDSECQTWRLLLWSCNDCGYKLLDFSGFTEDEEHGAIGLLDLKTNQLTFLSRIQNDEVEPLFNTRGVTDIFIDYEEWRGELRL